MYHSCPVNLQVLSTASAQPVVSDRSAMAICEQQLCGCSGAGSAIHRGGVHMLW